MLLCLFLRRLRFSAACPAAGYPWGFRNLSGSSCLSCSGGGAWFSTLCRALPPGPTVCAAYPAAGCPCGFSATVCLTSCCAGGVRWSATFLFCYRCFSCTGWLAGVCWVLLPVSGCSHRGCVCSVVDGIIVLLGSTCLWAFVCCSVVSTCGSGLLWGLCGSLLAFPCLRVGALLACSVSGASLLRSCSLGCPLWLVLMFVLHLLLQWEGLVPGLGPLLLLLCVGFLWGLCCAVLSPWLLVTPSSFSCASLGLFLWRWLGLGLVGCGPAWVPVFFWWGTLLPFSWLFSLGGSSGVVVQAPCVLSYPLSWGSFLLLPVYLIARGSCG